MGKLIKLFIILFIFFPSPAISATARLYPLRVPEGWVAPVEGYFFDNETMIDFASAAFTAEAEADVWKSAYAKLKEDMENQLDMQIQIATRLSSDLRDLSSKFNAERTNYEKLLRKSKMPGLGIYAGYGLSYPSNNLEFNVGVGLVFRVY